ncbi:MAG: hypothetical protein ASUL_05196 [Candidatus Aramenus sulfurataquae]|jgi:hypothetical protein|uniref:Uncharacterized protein n=2 Tax=Candidatus Aramenus sulfurataquae TaxID=1326980 RepID=W7KVQ7_9CREN|nr:MAG: hypothetical protein ASUL_05196 [Candidatus Aramenus sulfurataquae]MCL7343263.1 hypothetical protein [Candidatus Aramenus sulfurataquae]
MDIEDKILLLRGVLGVIAGAISSFVGSIVSAGVVAIIGYVLSVLVVYAMFKLGKKWLLFGKGTLTYVVAWFLILVLVYNILV